MNGIDDKNVPRDFLKFTAQQIKFYLQANHPNVLEYFRSIQSDRIFQIWERRPYSSTIYNRLVLEQKLDYIHNNPIVEKWSLAKLPEDYTYRSAKFYLHDATDFDLSWLVIT